MPEGPSVDQSTYDRAIAVLLGLAESCGDERVQYDAALALLATASDTAEVTDAMYELGGYPGGYRRPRNDSVDLDAPDPPMPYDRALLDREGLEPVLLKTWGTRHIRQKA